MIDKQALIRFVEKELEGTPMFLVDVEVTPDNSVTVEIDSDTAVDIDRCVELSRSIEQAFDREADDYDLEVGSCGITSPFKVLRQYKKNIGRDVEVLTRDGKKYKGLLRDAGDDSFTVTVREKVKPEGAKRPVQADVDRSFGYDDVEYTKYLLKF